MLLGLWTWCLLISLSVIVYTYVLYPLALSFYRLTLGRNTTHAASPDDESLPLVSVILAAYNEEDAIADKIKNCLGLDYPTDRVEIWIGSDGSSDQTDEIMAGFKDERVHTISFSERRGKMAVVNDLVSYAKGEICFFSDITETLDQSALRAVAKHYADHEIGAVTGNHVYRNDGSGISMVTRVYWKLQRAIQVGESRLYSVVACDGTIYSCRRELFPYPQPDTINDDVAVPLGILRENKRVIYEPRAIAWGDALTTMSNFARQKTRGQAGMYQIILRHLDLLSPIHLRRWSIYISHCVMPLLVPWMLIVCLFSSFMLARESRFAFGLLVAQVLAYALAAAGLIMDRTSLRFPPASLCFYFVVANVSSLCGFVAFITGKQKGQWRKVEGRND